jgi:hypothetical protein
MILATCTPLSPGSSAKPASAQEPVSLAQPATAQQPVSPPQGVEPPAARDSSVSPPSVATTQGPDSPASDFSNYTAVMVRTLLDSGATRAASVLQTWLNTGRLEAAELDAAAHRCLLSAGYLDASGHDQPSDCAQRTLEAWRAVLSGQSSDLSASGERTLDEWSAGLVTALLGRSEQVAGEIKKRLRRAGIAAFGMIAQAA